MASAAVITADIVNSTLLSKAAGKKLIGSLQAELKVVQSEFYRGDSFQVYLPDPGQALGLLLKLRTTARQLGTDYDIRASIGIGKTEAPVSRLSTAAGEAFLLSGRSMDDLGKSGGRLLALVSADKKQEPALEIMSLFIDYIFRDLTPKQARVLALLLEGSTQLAVAKEIKKSQSTVSKHVQSSGWNELTKLLQIYRQLFN